jgi:chromosome segregation ATPase
VPALLPRALVEKARATMNTPRPQERKNLARGWELRSLIRCPSCGGAMGTHTAKRGDKLYHYYRCHRSVDYRRNSCRQRMVRAETAEAAMWQFVSEILKDPTRIRVGMDALIEQKRGEIRANLERETKAWLERLAEVDQQRRGYLRLAAKGHMTEHELEEILTELEERRRMAKEELEAIGDRQTEIEQLEHDRSALLASWSGAVPRNLDDLTPQERNAL